MATTPGQPSQAVTQVHQMSQQTIPTPATAIASSQASNAGAPLSAAEQREAAMAEALLDARQAPSVILEGEMGTGKTSALRTLLMDKNGGFTGPSVSGIDYVFMINHEGGFEDVLGDIPAEKLGWKYIPVSEGSFDALIAMVQTINTQHPDTIQKMGGINKHMYKQFEQLLVTCNNAIDERTGKVLGPIFKFPQNWCLWYESISALTEIAKNNAIGDKPFMEMRDYQMVQNPVRKFLNHVVFSTKCLFVATAHLEREMDPTTNMPQLMISTVGKALAPVIPRFFSDVIVCLRTDAPPQPPTFQWATTVPGIRTKTRNLPWAQNMPPDFRPLMQRFKERKMKGGK
jgi:hypothetical protein